MGSDGVGAGCSGFCAPNPDMVGGCQEGFLEEWYLSLILKDELAKHDIEGIPGW